MPHTSYKVTIVGNLLQISSFSELKLLWLELKLVHRRPRHPQSQGSVERANADIKSMIISWTHENNNTHWSEGLRFVQFKKIRSYHRTIDQSPYSVLFGSDPKVGLSSSAIPKEILDTLETEEDLNALTTTETPTNRNDTNQTTPEADTDIETETNTESETETNTEPETETNTEPETGTNTATDAHFDIDQHAHRFFHLGVHVPFYLHLWGYIQMFGGAMYPLTLHLGVQRK